MVAGSILPVAIHKNKLYFLFGKENPMEDSSKGFSDFGGGVEPGETVGGTAAREGAEELGGFLGDPSKIRKLMKENGGSYKLSHNDYHVHIFRMNYDPNLPEYYNANHSFLWKRMNKKLLNKSKLFEKIEIDWFSPDNMKSRRNEFRGFYREIVDKILGEQGRIKSFIKRHNALFGGKRKTKKRFNNSTNRKTRRR
jgi:8-oxo-dGTP pyrophosphatase MutT (NUDIX family)